MKEGVSKYRALMGVQIYEISDKYIYDLRNVHPRHEAFDRLPKFTVNTNKNANNKIMPAEYFLQFAGHHYDEEINKNKYLLFDLITLDRGLEYEISQCGEDNLFEGIDFHKILSVFPHQNDDDLKNFSFPQTNYIIVDLIYITSYDYYSGGWEGDLEIEIKDYLDNNLNVKSYEKKED